MHKYIQQPKDEEKVEGSERKKKCEIRFFHFTMSQQDVCRRDMNVKIKEERERKNATVKMYSRKIIL